MIGIIIVIIYVIVLKKIGFYKSLTFLLDLITLGIVVTAVGIIISGFFVAKGIISGIVVCMLLAFYAILKISIKSQLEVLLNKVKRVVTLSY
ncbi:MAG: hypothetical protein KA384_09405 [Leptotrichiaceae bacterium]|nr:hypothetical protein [Leptotrichiaceae bacterium]